MKSHFQNKKKQNISEREQQVLQLIAHEHNTQQIAEELFVSYETAHSHRKNLLKKLHVKNTAGMVRVAFERGLLRLGQQVAMVCLFVMTYCLAATGQNYSTGQINLSGGNITINNLPAPTSCGSNSVTVSTCSGSGCGTSVGNTPISERAHANAKSRYDTEVSMNFTGQDLRQTDVVYSYLTNYGTNDQEVLFSELKSYLGNSGQFSLRTPQFAIPYFHIPLANDLTVVQIVIKQFDSMFRPISVDVVEIPLLVTGSTEAQVPELGVTTSPSIPYMVLHDPPGDESYSTYAQGTEFCRSLSTTFKQGSGFSNETALTLGVKGSAGFILTTEYEASATASVGVEFSTESIVNSEVEQCVSLTSSFSTADTDDNPGADSDLFIGYSRDIHYGLSEISYLDPNTCTTFIEDGIAYYENEFIDFAWTKDVLEQELADAEAIIDDWTPEINDLQVAQAENQRDVLQRVLSLSGNFGNLQTTVDRSGGQGEATFAQGISTSNSFSLEYEVSVGVDLGLDLVANVGGSGVTNTSELTFNMSFGSVSATTNTSTTEIAYAFKDDDTGDRFIIDVGRDPNYGSPTFRIQTSNTDTKTSCPYEGGIRRDNPSMTVSSSQAANCADDYFIVDDIPYGQGAIFSFELCNDSPETRDYILALNNLNNAEVPALGQDGQKIYTINSNSCQTLTMIINRNSSYPLPGQTGYQESFDIYKDLAFSFYPECGFAEEEGEEVVINVRYGESFEDISCDRLYVNSIANGENHGRNWANSFTNLQDALSVAQAGDTIFVAEGNYYPTSSTDRNISHVMKEGVVMLGGFPSAGSPTLQHRDWKTHQSILDGNIGDINSSTDNSLQVLFSEGLSSATVLDGFYIKNGRRGMTIRNSDLLITNCIFFDNLNILGLGLGGAMTIENDSEPTIENSTFYRNKSKRGGAIWIRDSPNTSIINSVFYLNEANNYGGAIFGESVTTVLNVTNCSFTQNTAAADQGSAIWNSNGQVSISNSILWNNGSEEIATFNSTVTVDHSIVTQSIAGTGNLSMDPLFVHQTMDPINDPIADVHLTLESPALDAGTATGAPAFDLDGNIRPQGMGVDMGAYESQSLNECAQEYANGTELSGTNTKSYAAVGELQSSQTIPANSNRFYKSETSVELTEGFVVESSAVFDAFIDDCANIASLINSQTGITEVVSVNSPPGEDYTKIIDGDITTKYVRLSIYEVLGFVVDLGDTKTCNMISITTANDGDNRDPTRLFISGSNDGVNFTDIGSEINIECSPNRFYTRYIELANEIPYQHYKFILDDVCDSGPENIIQLAEVDMYGY